VGSEKIVIIVSGLAASGKSTLAVMLAEALSLRRCSGGMALKTVAARIGLDTSGEKWWDSELGLRFLSLRERDFRYDRMVDEELISAARRGGVVIDSWILPWLYDGGFKVWLKADKTVRAARLSDRSGLQPDEAVRVLEERDSRNRALYKKIYGVDISVDLEPFHLVLDTSRLSAGDVFDVVLTAVRRFFKLR